MNVKKKKALGRGLDALMGQPGRREIADPDSARLRELPVDTIHPGRYQPRSVFDPDKLRELADSIEAQGVVQPVVVHRREDGDYELIAGERRWRAAQMAGLERIPAVIRQVDDERMVALALIENIQREDLNPLEEANALNRLIDEFGLTHQQAAEAVGRSRTAVSNLLRLLSLEEPVRRLLNQGQLDMGHARALLSLPARDQAAVATKVVNLELSVRQTESLVKRLLKGADKPAPRQPNADIQRLESKLSEQLGARVAISHGKGGKGKLVISYNNLDELDGILDHIK